MAERRMFTQKIVDSDAFLDMPLSTQSLYFHLNMRADDDGFVNNPRKIQRMIGASDDDLRLLLAKRFLLGFENGVVVIKHWRMHNLLRKDRYNPTQYIEEMNKLSLNDNGSYTEKAQTECLTTTWQPNGNQMATQDSIGKDSIVEVRVDKGRVDYQLVADMYNDICISFPRLTVLSEKRKQAIKARSNTYTLSQFEDMFHKAESSSFLKGANPRNWRANFDWLMKDANFAKVLDGNYEDKPKNPNKSYDTDDFFEASLARSHEEMDKELKTAGNDEALRERAEALKKQLC